MARTKADSEIASISKEIKLRPSEMKRLKEHQKKTGVAVATFIKRATFEILDKNEDSVSPQFSPVRVLGFIPGGPTAEVQSMPDHTFVTPPFEIGQGCYALLVVGDSMESKVGISVPNGAYAFFCPAEEPQMFYGDLVHVEWEEDGVHVCTLKKYAPQPDGKTVLFEPLNKKHEAIERPVGQYKIRGKFMRSWKDS